MINSFHIIPKEQQSTNPWSGGETTQLYIYPKSATVEHRNFKLRISTATVTAPESTFTNFEGYDRLLMILEGKLFISHSNFHSRVLNPFEIDSFQGRTGME